MTEETEGVTIPQVDNTQQAVKPATPTAVKPATPTAVKPATPTTEDRITTLETNYATLLKKLRKSIAFFDRK